MSGAQTATGAWIEVDLNAIAANISAVRDWVGPRTDVMAVVKANAYGHGLVPAARAALKGGAAALGVARLEEGLRLRSAGIGAPVVVLGCALPEQAEALVRAGLSQTVSDIGLARALSQASLALDKPARVHLKIDTGMGRVGVHPEDAPALGGKIVSLPGLTLEGIATHIPWDEAVDMPRAEAQIARFKACLQALGLRPRWRHAANSVITARMPHAHLDLVRVGLLTYGIPPADGAPHIGLRPALSIKARLVQIRSMQPGQTVSYGGTFTVTRPSRLAVVPIGYADGYARSLSNRAQMLIRGQRCPVVGRICMDQTVVDVTGVPGAAVGDEVIALGRAGGDEISVWELANLADSITHEVVSRLSRRLPRVFI